MQGGQRQVNQANLKFFDNTYIVSDKRESVLLRFPIFFFFLLMHIFALGRLMDYILTHNEKNSHSTEVWSSSSDNNI